MPFIAKFSETSARGFGFTLSSKVPAPPPGAIGSAYEGGFYAGEISVAGNGVASHYLVVIAKSSQASRQWKNALTATPNANSDIDGPQNTADMVADGSATVYPAAHYCNNLTVNGYTDWYMPAKNELEICYYNLKPGTFNNVTTQGININAVPTRNSNYTAGTPAQTSATDFKVGNAQAFDQARYWASTELAAQYAALTYFYTGNVYTANKTYTGRVRAVRRVAI
jgi:hypothetical protein